MSHNPTPLRKVRNDYLNEANKFNYIEQNCPPGLEYLTTIDQLLVKQKVELLEAFTGFETNNKFTIKNSLGQKVTIGAISRRIEHTPNWVHMEFFINPFARCIGLWKWTIAVHAIAADQPGHSIWKSWTSIRTKWSIWIVHWLAQAAASHAVCKQWKFLHRPVMLLGASNRNGLSAIRAFRWKIITVKQCCALKDRSVHFQCAAMLILRYICKKVGTCSPVSLLC